MTPVMTRSDAVALALVVAIYVGVPLALRLRERWRLVKAREQAQQLLDYVQAAHLYDCRRGHHRTTLDAEYADVYYRGGPSDHTIQERCVDCGVSVPFGRVTTFTLPHRKKKAHG